MVSLILWFCYRHLIFQHLRKKLVLESCAGNCVEDCSSHWWSADFFDQFQSTIFFFIIFQFFNQFFQHFRKKFVLESCVGNCVEDCGSHWWSTNFLKTLKEQKLSICYNIFYQRHFMDQTMWSANIQFSFSTENGHSCLKIVIVKMLEQFLSLKHRFIVHRCERGLEHRRQVKTEEVMAMSQNRINK